MTIHPDTQTRCHDKPAEPGADHEVAPPALPTDAADRPLLDVSADLDGEEIVPLGRRSPQPRPQTPPRYPWQPRILVAATAATLVSLTITIVVLLALFDGSKPRHDRRVSPAIAVNSPAAVAQPDQAAATPRGVRHQRTLAQRDVQQHQHARRVAAQKRARDRRVAQRNRRALAQRRRLATQNARARAAAWRREHTSRRSTPTPARSHTTTPPPPPARSTCGDFDVC